MNNCTITLDRKQLLAALLFAGTKDVRFYPNGVQVEATATQTRLHATDGATVGLFRLSTVNDMGGETVRQFTIRRGTLDKVKPALRKAAMVTVQINADGYTLHVDDQVITFVPLGGVFPDVRRIVPATKGSGVAGQFNPEYVARCSKAAKLLGNKNSMILIAHNGPDHCAMVTVPRRTDFCAVLMPLRVRDLDVSDTSWASAA